MNDVVLSKDNWLNEVEAFITGKTFEKIDDNTYRKESIQYTGNVQCKKWFDFLYKDATIYLQRKYNKINN